MGSPLYRCPGRNHCRTGWRQLLEHFLRQKCCHLECKGAVFDRARQLLHRVVSRTKGTNALLPASQLVPEAVRSAVALHFSQTILQQPVLDNRKHQRVMRVGYTYWVVMNHHAVQQSGQGVEATCIQTWEGDKNSAHSEPATLLLGSKRVEIQGEISLGAVIYNKAADSQENQPDWPDRLLKEKQTDQRQPDLSMHQEAPCSFRMVLTLAARGRAVHISGTERILQVLHRISTLPHTQIHL